MKFSHNYILKMLLFVFLMYNSTPADHYKRNTGIDIQHYKFKIILNDSTDCITAETETSIKFLSNGINRFELDLSGLDSATGKGMVVSKVEHGSKTIEFLQLNNRLEIKLGSPSVKDGIEIFKIKYSGIPADGLIISKNKYGDRTFFGDNWPDRAHCWLPVVDHPYDKATCDFIVTAPSEYKVVANGLLIEEKDLSNNLRLTHWRENIPIAAYVMVIGAAKFAIQNLHGSNKLPVESWAYLQDSVNVFYDLYPAKDIVKYFASLIGPFPYEKLANVESKTIYGGMENSSAIFYSEPEITGTRRSLVTVAHEIAHQWFGDAVTEADWDHIWLSEGFATYFQNVFIAHQFGNDSLLNAIKRERNQIINYDKTNPNSAVVDTSITKLTDLLNINSYQKGGWVLRMLQHILGDRIFYKGIRSYYKAYRNGNALTKDFETAMEKVSGKKLNWFFNEWIYKPGLPYLTGGWQYSYKSRQLVVKIKQVQEDGNIFKMPLDLGIYSESGKRIDIKKVEISSGTNEFKFSLKHKPLKVVVDPNVWMLMSFDFKEE